MSFYSITDQATIRFYLGGQPFFCVAISARHPHCEEKWQCFWSQSQSSILQPSRDQFVAHAKLKTAGLPTEKERYLARLCQGRLQMATFIQ